MDWNVLVGIWLGNNHSNFQSHRFTRSENIAKSFREGGLLFDSHCICSMIALVAMLCVLCSQVTAGVRCSDWVGVGARHSRRSVAPRQLTSSVYRTQNSNDVSTSSISSLLVSTSLALPFPVLCILSNFCTAHLRITQPTLFLFVCVLYKCSAKEVM